MPETASWFCCQLGAREHYAVPRALQTQGQLAGLVTDAWVRPGSPFGLIKRSLRERYHASLADAPVRSANAGLLAFELSARLRGHIGWEKIMARNRWFQEHALRVLEKLKVETLETEIGKREISSTETLTPSPSPIRWARVASGSPQRGEGDFAQRSTLSAQPTVFAYSYAALEIFRWAKAQGWRTVLGQIDPGPTEETIVARLQERHCALGADWQPAPPAYWELWREECRLADRVVVNSEWSQSALLQAGVPAEKLRVIPLAYERAADQQAPQRTYPSAFSPKRPLRVLFLGQINLRKGIAEVFESIRLLAGTPVEFWLVGPLQVLKPPDLKCHPQVRWVGPVSRGAAAGFYREADVFLLPTHSDGFALTQLEALAHGLPIVCSQNCGVVVEAGENGLLLPEVTGAAIAEVLRGLLACPEKLVAWSANARISDRFSLSAIGNALLEL